MTNQPKPRKPRRPRNTPTPAEQLDAEAQTAPADVARMLAKARRISERLYALLTAKLAEDEDKDNAGSGR
jgi:hypothetical protein